MRDFGDKSLSNGLFLLELLMAIEPRCVDREMMTPGETNEEKLCPHAQCHHSVGTISPPLTNIYDSFGSC